VTKQLEVFLMIWLTYMSHIWFWILSIEGNNSY